MRKYTRRRGNFCFSFDNESDSIERNDIFSPGITTSPTLELDKTLNKEDEIHRSNFSKVKACDSLCISTQDSKVIKPKYSEFGEDKCNTAMSYHLTKLENKQLLNCLSNQNTKDNQTKLQNPIRLPLKYCQNINANSFMFSRVKLYLDSQRNSKENRSKHLSLPSSIKRKLKPERLNTKKSRILDRLDNLFITKTIEGIQYLCAEKEQSPPKQLVKDRIKAIKRRYQINRRRIFSL